MAADAPIDVCAFLTELREHIAEGGEDLSKYDAIGRLISVCRKYNLRMRQEFVQTVDGGSDSGDANDDANDDNGDDDGGDTDTPQPTRTARRVIISTERFNNTFAHPVSFQCNGLVLDSDTWEVLSYPVPVCKTIYNKKALTEGVRQSKYEIYRIRDGTVVTLYWYEPEQRWCMSSANGFQINNYKWMGDTTYEEALMKLSENYEGFSFDGLDKKKCYTVGFRYHDFHPFLQDPESIWFIQSCDLGELNANNKLNIITSTGDAPTEVEMLERQTSILVKPEDADRFMKNMVSDCRSSTNDVLRATGTPNIVYGFIFRDPTNTYGEHSNVVIESELMKVLRRLLYNFNDVKRDNRITVDHTNRMSFIVVRSYLNYMYRSLFIQLMPQFALQYDQYTKTTNSVVSKIIYYLRNRNARQRASVAGNRKTTFDEVVYGLTDYVSKNSRVNVHDSNTKSIIYDMVVTPNFTHMYYKLLATDSADE